jgi:hypothetical protein
MRDHLQRLDRPPPTPCAQQPRPKGCTDYEHDDRDCDVSITSTHQAKDDPNQADADPRDHDEPQSARNAHAEEPQESVGKPQHT